ncbi:hypothetical protein [Arthrobacter sp. B0490]|uniref:hypothetical protein n=1 Tax=Arthrobacter sp. B0490 TaxID=2058891 RepID=UPI0011AFFADF|nr:hypothetical protein [Arthrobacter sp. B0490]
MSSVPRRGCAAGTPHTPTAARQGRVRGSAAGDPARPAPRGEVSRVLVVLVVLAAVDSRTRSRREPTPPLAGRKRCGGQDPTPISTRRKRV